ncbi:hypothetical protein J6590_083869 [Homalodisca vitripennis]|nr:hypothetical protein J6590_083869 [Homalodisca vitripennis]
MSLCREVQEEERKWRNKEEQANNERKRVRNRCLKYTKTPQYEIMIRRGTGLSSQYSNFLLPRRKSSQDTADASYPKAARYSATIIAQERV